MFERYTLSCTYFPSQSFDETGCDYLIFPTPGMKDHVTVDIYYSLEDRKGIHTKEINLLNFKEWHNLPSWSPIFQLPYQIDAKVTCTGFYVYIEIIYINSSPDPDIFAPSLTTNQVTSSDDTYTTTLTTQTTSAIIEIKTDKSLQFQVNCLNIARVMSITT